MVLKILMVCLNLSFPEETRSADLVARQRTTARAAAQQFRCEHHFRKLLHGFHALISRG
jgi:hypothetical protein